MTEKGNHQPTHAAHADEHDAPAAQRAPQHPADLHHCRVFNPGLSPKVIYGGAGNSVPYRVEPGQTVEADLPGPLIDRLAEYEHHDPAAPGLHVEELGSAGAAEQGSTGRRPRPGRSS